MIVPRILSTMAVNWEVELIPCENKSLQSANISIKEEEDGVQTFFNRHNIRGSVLDSLSSQHPKSQPTEFMDMMDHGQHAEIPAEPIHYMSSVRKSNGTKLKQQSPEKSPNMRKSSRERKKPRSFSPELGGTGRKRCKKNIMSNLHLYARPYDKLPDGRPFACDLCRSPYICESQRTVTAAGKKIKYSPRYKTDPKTLATLTLCNACGLAFDRAHPKKPKKPKPSLEEDKKKFVAEAYEFSRSMVAALNDPEAERLSCPHYTSKPCGCLQTYIRAGGESDYEHRARELLELLKQGKQLISDKKSHYDPEDIGVKAKKGVIGLGNGQKRSKEYVNFVMENRVELRDKFMLCEKATQRILSYSNNFLHKRLKTEGNDCRKPREKGRVALGMVIPVSQIHKLKCCANNCVRMALTHQTLLAEWRRRAAQGQMEARRVIAEMLTPSGGTRTNCYVYISAVTGTSASTIGRVREQMRLTGGVREPPEHGLKKYWENKQMKKKASEVVVINEDGMALEKSGNSAASEKSGNPESLSVSQSSELKMLDRDDSCELSIAKIPSPHPLDTDSLHHTSSVSSEQIMQLEKHVTQQQEQQLLWQQILQQSGAVQVVTHNKDNILGKISDADNIQIIYTQPDLSVSSPENMPHDIVLQAVPAFQQQLGMPQTFSLNQIVTLLPVSSNQLLAVQQAPSGSVQAAMSSSPAVAGSSGSSVTPHMSAGVQAPGSSVNDVNTNVLGTISSIVPVIPKLASKPQSSTHQSLSSLQNTTPVNSQSFTDTPSTRVKSSSHLPHMSNQSVSSVRQLASSPTLLQSLVTSQPVSAPAQGSRTPIAIPLSTLQQVLSSGQILHLPTTAAQALQTQLIVPEQESDSADARNTTVIEGQTPIDGKMGTQSLENPEIVIMSHDGDALDGDEASKGSKHSYGHSEELYQLLIENSPEISVSDQGLQHVIQVQAAASSSASGAGTATEEAGLQVIHIRTGAGESAEHSELDCSQEMSLSEQSLPQVIQVPSAVGVSRMQDDLVQGDIAQKVSSNDLEAAQIVAQPGSSVDHAILTPSSFSRRQNQSDEVIHITPVSSDVDHQMAARVITSSVTSLSTDCCRNPIQKSAEIAQVLPLSPGANLSDDLGNSDSTVTLFTEGLSQNDVIVANQDDSINIPQYYDVAGNTLLNTINMTSTNYIIAQLREYNPHMTFIQTAQDCKQISQEAGSVKTSTDVQRNRDSRESCASVMENRETADASGQLPSDSNS